MRTISFHEYEEQREAIEDTFNLEAGEARAEFKRAMATIKARRDNALAIVQLGRAQGMSDEEIKHAF